MARRLPGRTSDTLRGRPAVRRTDKHAPALLRAQGARAYDASRAVALSALVVLLGYLVVVGGSPLLAIALISAIATGLRNGSLVDRRARGSSGRSGEAAGGDQRPPTSVRPP